MKLALYARVSSHTQQKHGTIASQLEALRRHAGEHGHTIVEEYVCLDDGVSGAILARPGLDRLRDGAEGGQFDGVLVLSPDRLARKYAYLILMQEEFERLGVPLLFVEQPPGDDPQTALLTQIQGAVAEYERAKLAERYRRGKIHRARQGEIFWTTVPFGYRHVPRRDGVPAHVEIDEERAATVRTIFHWHADEGLSLRQIAKRLTVAGIPPPRGGKCWGTSTIHRIVHNEAYIGTIYYNRARHTLEPAPWDGGGAGRALRKKTTIRPQEEWIAVTVPAIVERRTFERSRSRHEPNRRFSPRRLKEERWLLRRLLRCGRCGYKHACVADARNVGGPATYYYRCGRSEGWTQPSRCRPNHVRAEPLDELVWDALRRHLLHPELLMRAKSHLSEASSLDGSFLEEQLRAAGRRLRQAQTERGRLLDAYQGGFLAKAEFEQRMGRLAERIRALEAEAQGLKEERRTAAGTTAVQQRLEEFTRVVASNLDTMGFAQRQKLARMVLQEVVLEEDQVHLYFKLPLPHPDGTPPRGKPRPRAWTVSGEFSLRPGRDQGVDVGVEVGGEGAEGLDGGHGPGPDVLALV